MENELPLNISLTSPVLSFFSFVDLMAIYGLLPNKATQILEDFSIRVKWNVRKEIVQKKTLNIRN